MRPPESRECRQVQHAPQTAKNGHRYGQTVTPQRRPRRDRVNTLAGLPDLRVAALPGLPRGFAPTVACADIARRLQLRGQSRIFAPRRARATAFPF